MSVKNREKLYFFFATIGCHPIWFLKIKNNGDAVLIVIPNDAVVRVGPIGDQKLVWVARRFQTDFCLFKPHVLVKTNLAVAILVQTLGPWGRQGHNGSPWESRAIRHIHVESVVKSCVLSILLLF